jgi:macrolide-specific efflux system membrane fusion protein
MKNEKLKINNYNKMFIISAFCFFIFAISLVGCGGEKEAPLQKIKVERGSIKAQISTTGIVEPRNRLEIKPPISGRIESVLASEGDNVKKAQVLAWMSSSERAALLDAARSKGEAELKHWEDVYKPAPIVAPLNGFIIQRNVEPGQTVTTGDPILVMADRLIVKAEVDETDISSIILGQSVNIVLDAYPGEQIKGKVEHIAYESKTINNVNIYEVNILPEKVPSFFRSGMSTTVSFVLREKNDVLILPLNAVKKNLNNSYVFVMPENAKEVQSVQIKTGLENDVHVEIESGLSEGDEVVIPTAKMVEELKAKFERRRGPVNPLQRRN